MSGAHQTIHSLVPEEKTKAVMQAYDYYQQNYAAVKNEADASRRHTTPSITVALKPGEWRPSHWKWFLRYLKTNTNPRSRD